MSMDPPSFCSRPPGSFPTAPPGIPISFVIQNSRISPRPHYSADQFTASQAFIPGATGPISGNISSVNVPFFSVRTASTATIRSPSFGRSQFAATTSETSVETLGNVATDEQKKLKCMFCPSAIPERKMCTHLRFHLGYKPVKCCYCRQRFTDEDACEVHTLEYGHLPVKLESCVEDRPERVVNLCLLYCQQAELARGGGAAGGVLKSLWSVIEQEIKLLQIPRISGAPKLPPLLSSDSSSASTSGRSRQVERTARYVEAVTAPTVTEPLDEDARMNHEGSADEATDTVTPPSDDSLPGEVTDAAQTCDGREAASDAQTAKTDTHGAAAECATCSAKFPMSSFPQLHAEHVARHLHDDGLPWLYECRDCTAHGAARKADIVKHAAATGHGFVSKLDFLKKYIRGQWCEFFPKCEVPESMEEALSLPGITSCPTNASTSRTSPTKPQTRTFEVVQIDDDDDQKPQSISTDLLEPKESQPATPPSSGRKRKAGAGSGERSPKRRPPNDETIGTDEMTPGGNTGNDQTIEKHVTTPGNDDEPQPSGRCEQRKREMRSLKAWATCAKCMEDVIASKGRQEAHVWMKHMRNPGGFECYECPSHFITWTSAEKHAKTVHKTTPTRGQGSKPKIRDNREQLAPVFQSALAKCFPPESPQLTRSPLKQRSGRIRAEKEKSNSPAEDLPILEYMGRASSVSAESSSSTGDQPVTSSKGAERAAPPPLTEIPSSGEPQTASHVPRVSEPVAEEETEDVGKSLDLNGEQEATPSYEVGHFDGDTDEDLDTIKLADSPAPAVTAKMSTTVPNKSTGKKKGRKPEKSYICEKCSSVILGHQVRAHCIQHIGEEIRPVYACSICPASKASFKRKELADRHIATEHGGSKVAKVKFESDLVDLMMESERQECFPEFRSRNRHVSPTGGQTPRVVCKILKSMILENLGGIATASSADNAAVAELEPTSHQKSELSSPLAERKDSGSETRSNDLASKKRQSSTDLAAKASKILELIPTKKNAHAPPEKPARAAKTTPKRQTRSSSVTEADLSQKAGLSGLKRAVVPLPKIDILYCEQCEMHIPDFQLADHVFAHVTWQYPDYYRGKCSKCGACAKSDQEMRHHVLAMHQSEKDVTLLVRDSDKVRKRFLRVEKKCFPRLRR